ncbi:MAG: hypothetical protein NTV70_12910, partial [Acidobacteria bacterium]|nr:hypothetical protein [Acidobacteriota bacterium]
TDKGLEPLRALVALRRFEAVRTRFGQASAAVLASLTNLEAVNLDYTALNDDGLKLLAALPQLRELHLDSATISDAGLLPLASAKRLTSLNLYHTLVSEQGHAKLAAELPACKIVWDRDSRLPNRRGS